MGRRVSDAITPDQRKALESLATVVDPETYLAGGVAIALRLGHRTSRDLDLFTPADPTTHADAFANPNLQTTIVGRSDGSLQLEVNGVPASWLRYRYPMLCPPERIEAIPIPIVSLDDATCMKVSAIAGRGAARDFWDLHAILVRESLSLEQVLALFKRKYATEDIGHVVKSLSYFGDADASPLPKGLSAAAWTSIKADFESRVRNL
jgi:hypothetical protein